MITPLYNLNINNKPTIALNISFKGLIKSRLKNDVLEIKNEENKNYNKAVEYLNKKRKRNRKFRKNPSLAALDLDKLDGIQEGIEVFKGLSMKEIQFLTKNLNAILLLRGCRNNCSHCFVCAKPPINNGVIKEDNKINTILWDDYKSTLNGIKQLNDRLGFQSIELTSGFKTNTPKYISLFEDSDPINLKSYDQDGNPHNIAEAIKTMNEYLDLPILFDTSGWFKTDHWAKQAAEDLVEYTMKNPDGVSKINISINPFHGFMTRSTELAKEGKYEKSEKLRSFYVERMAETLHTFLPLCKKGKLDILFRCADPKYPENTGYTNKDLAVLYQDIYKRLEQKCKKSPSKFINLDEEIEYLKFLKNYWDKKSYTYISSIGKGAGFKNARTIQKKKFNDNIDNIDVVKYFINKDKFIDINGNIIVGNEYGKFKSYIKLNFKNKEKKTAEV